MKNNRNTFLKYLIAMTLLSLLFLGGCGKDLDKEIATASFTPAERPTHEPIIMEKTDAKEPADDTVSIDAVSMNDVSENAAREADESDANSAADQLANSEPENLHYIDAWGEWHDTIINPNVEKHCYDFSLLKNDGQTASYEDENYYTRKGIDVSHHQGEIDWQKVRDAGYEFAILRIAYRGYGEDGTLNADHNFDSYLAGAHAAGLEVGVYIFSQAINEAEAKEEADYVLALLNGKQIELSIVYDPESIRDAAARTDSVSGEQFTQNTAVFCQTIQRAGYQPMIYSNMIWEADLLNLEALATYPIWYADYEKLPQSPYHFSYWQYTSDGKVPGIAGRVDLDLQFIQK